MDDFWASFQPRRVTLSFWRICIDDVLLITLALSVFLIISLSTWIANFTYQDSFISLAMALFPKDPPPADRFSRFLPRPIRSYFPPTYIHPLLLRFFLAITGRTPAAAQFLSIILSTILSVYLFRRVLLIFNAVRDPLFTTVLFCIGPANWTLLRSTPTSDAWEFVFLCFALITFGMDEIIFLSSSLFLAAATRLESLILYPIFGGLYLFRKQSLHAGILVIIGVVYVTVLLYFPLATEPLGTYLCAPYPYARDVIQPSPFHYFAKIATSISNLGPTHAFVALLAPSFVGAIALVQKCAPLGIMATVWIIAASVFGSEAMYRLIVPGQIFALLVGFDDLFTTSTIRRFVYGFAVFYVVIDIFYAKAESPKERFPEKLWMELR
jgi:hypothetical protein